MARTKTSTAEQTDGFSSEEKAAMKARAQELKAQSRASKNRADGEKALLAAIAEMKDPDRALATRLHELVSAAAPALLPKTWYGMPAWVNADGKTICFFQAASKFGTRYATFGFQPDAKLDDGGIWATSFAILELNPKIEAQVTALVKKSLG
jgi:uncharacterized protein YdhG (YjbR/CyaY superfamily)